MEPSRLTRVKICCISSAAEAELAVRFGASALGLVSAMPSGPGVIGEELIAEIARAVPPGVATFLLTSLEAPDALVAQARRCGTSAIQICDRVEIEAYAALRRELPSVKLVQVIHVTGPEAEAEAVAAAEVADALLLDSGNPRLAVKELGGTGRVHDWTVSRRIRESARVPVFLAGGLRPDNVGDAIRGVRPFAVDICSGVRTGGVLDEARLAAFFAAVRACADLEE